MLTTALFGVLPSLLLARGDLAAVRGEMRSALGHRTQWLQSGLVVFEVALALAPLLGAALVLQSVQRLLHQDPGFRPEQAVAFRIQLPPERYRDEGSKRAVVTSFLTRLRALPGVSYVGAINYLPLSGSNANGNFSIEGQVFEKAHEPAIEYRFASAGIHRGHGHRPQGGPDVRGFGLGPEPSRSRWSMRRRCAASSPASHHIGAGIRPGRSRGP